MSLTVGLHNVHVHSIGFRCLQSKPVVKLFRYILSFSIILLTLYVFMFTFHICFLIFLRFISIFI